MNDFAGFGKKIVIFLNVKYHLPYLRKERFGSGEQRFLLGCAPAPDNNVFPIYNAFTQPK